MGVGALIVEMRRSTLFECYWIERIPPQLPPSKHSQHDSGRLVGPTTLPVSRGNRLQGGADVGVLVDPKRRTPSLTSGLIEGVHQELCQQLGAHELVAEAAHEREAQPCLQSWVRCSGRDAWARCSVFPMFLGKARYGRQCERAAW